MPESLRASVDSGKGRAGEDLSHRLGESSDTSPTLDAEDLRRQFADAYSRATWWIADHVAAALGLKRGTVGKWTAGERRSPGESVYLTTKRSLHEGLERESATAIVRLLATLILDADELEQIAAAKRLGDEGLAGVMRRTTREIQMALDDMTAYKLNGEIAVAIIRERRRLARELDELEFAMNASIRRGEGGAETSGAPAVARG